MRTIIIITILLSSLQAADTQSRVFMLDRGWPDRETLRSAVEECDLERALAPSGARAHVVLRSVGEMVHFDIYLLVSFDAQSDAPVLNLDGTTYNIGGSMGYRRKKDEPQFDDAMIRTMLGVFVSSVLKFDATQQNR